MTTSGPATIALTPSLDLAHGPDLRLVGRAVRDPRWAISPEIRDQLAGHLAKIALNPKNNPRQQIAAARDLMAIEAQNQADDLKVTPELHLHQHAPEKPLDVAAMTDDQLKAIVEEAGGVRS